VAANVSYRMPQAPGSAASAPDALIQLVRGLGPANYHALIIGNSNYSSMPQLKTPANDAREVAKVLEGRYGFEVKLLIDATRKDITSAMREYAHSLTDSDRLLIYYAGHGGTRIYPPERAFWLGVDADPDVPESWVSAQVVSDEISQIHARHISAGGGFVLFERHHAPDLHDRRAVERRAQRIDQMEPQRAHGADLRPG
jgi:uncharacterized caspase-like protein